MDAWARWSHAWLFWRAYGDWPSGRSRQFGPPVAGAFKLEEAVGGGYQKHAVPESGGGFATGHRGDDRAEKGRALDADDRRANVRADPLDAIRVAGAELRVVIG